MLGKFLAGLAIGVLLGVPPATAQQAVSSCVAIEDDAERLACYDAIFRDGELDLEGGVFVESERLIPARPTGREPATMSIRCEDGQMVVSFGFAGQLVSNTGDIAPLTYQVDASGNVARTLRAGEDNTSLSFASAADTEFFLDSLIGGRNLKVRMTPVRQRSLTVDFRLQAVADEIEALRAACS